MSTSEVLENSLCKTDEKNDVENQKENGAGAMSSRDDRAVSTPSDSNKNVTGAVSKLMSKHLPTNKLDVNMTPPPPPPTTPVQQKQVKKPLVDAISMHAQLKSDIIDDTNVCDKSEYTSVVPDPPPMPSKVPASVQKNSVKTINFKSDIKLGKLALIPPSLKNDQKIMVSKRICLLKFYYYTSHQSCL